MKYTPRFESVELFRVEGLDAYLCRLDSGLDFSVPAQIVSLLFQPAEKHPAARPPHRPRKTSKRKDAGSIAGMEIPTKPTYRKPAPAQSAILEVLRKRGPLTTAEIYSYAEPKPTSRETVFSVCYTLRRKHLIERRECPTTRLDKWFLSEKESK